MSFVTTDLIIGKALPAPVGHAQSVIETPLAAVHITESAVLVIPASGFVAATDVAGFDAAFVDIDTAVQTFISTTMGVDTTANSVDYNAFVQDIQEELYGEYKTDATRSINVRVTVKVRIY